MRIQNLGDTHRSRRSAFWHGRLWLRRFRAEWHLLKYSKSCSAELVFGSGENRDGLMIILCVPWLFEIYMTAAGAFGLKHPHRTGISAHHGAIWINPFVDDHETRSDSPWYERAIVFHAPWNWEWQRTEIMVHARNDRHLTPVYVQERGDVPSALADQVKASVTRDYRYEYRPKHGKLQHARASVCVRRMYYRRRWPIIPGKKITTIIDVAFHREIGERVGSYKGGCLGCSYEMLPDEHPYGTLMRMQRDRRFE